MASVPTRVTIDDETWFEAMHDPTDRWNGWASPKFDRATAERLVEWMNEFVAENAYESDVLSWDGNDVIGWCQMYADEGGEKYTPARWSPDAEGRYSIGAWAWTWTSEDQWGAMYDEDKALYVWRTSREPLDFDQAEALGFDGTLRDR